VAWVALGRKDQDLRLTWRWLIEVRAVVLYAIRADRRNGTDLQIDECELVFYRKGREVGRRRWLGPLSPTGTRVDCHDIRADEIQILPTHSSGQILRRDAVGLSEVETIARLAESETVPSR
jgi:hypothetical protein